MATPVLLDTSRTRPETHDQLLTGLVEASASRVGGQPSELLDLAAEWGLTLPRPGQGSTQLLWEALASLAAVDLQVARAAEPHLDALAILTEADEKVEPDSTWGVYAAEGPGVRLEAQPVGDGWVLSGTKPWCSLAAHVTHALVTAWVGDERRLFRVHLQQSGVDTTSAVWLPRGLVDIVSTPISFVAVPAEPVCEPSWYLDRDGFAWGGMGVAAIWYGGAVAVARRVRAAAEQRSPDQIGLWHLGMIDAALASARAVLREAAAAIDAGQANGSRGALLALRVRQVVFDTAETILRRADHGLGPGPLVGEPEHAARVADLHLYLRQHHAERDGANLGRMTLETASW